MISNGPTITRLEEAGFKLVKGAIEFAGLKTAPAHSPALFVITERETAGESRMSGVHDQRVTELMRVVIVLRASSRVEGAASDELREATEKVVGALAGWTHPDACAACNYAGGRLLSADGWGVAWAADFTTSWRLRK